MQCNLVSSFQRTNLYQKKCIFILIYCWDSVVPKTNLYKQCIFILHSFLKFITAQNKPIETSQWSDSEHFKTNLYKSCISSCPRSNLYKQIHTASIVQIHSSQDLYKNLYTYLYHIHCLHLMVPRISNADL